MSGADANHELAKGPAVQVLQRLREVGEGGTMVRLVSRLVAMRGLKAELVWGVDDPHDLEKQVPKLRLYRNLIRHLRYEF